jgi:hypothetical protein
VSGRAAKILVYVRANEDYRGWCEVSYNVLAKNTGNPDAAEWQCYKRNTKRTVRGLVEHERLAIMERPGLPPLLSVSRVRKGRSYRKRKTTTTDGEASAIEVVDRTNKTRRSLKR